MTVVIRDATGADVEAMTALYNASVATRTVAWSEHMQTEAERLAWLQEQQRRGFPVLVAEQAGVVVGFAAYADFRDSTKWPGYRFTAEHTIHVAQTAWGRGIGRALLEELIARADADGKHALVAAIDGDNVNSIQFHERLGFREVGRMPEIGFMFGRWLDLVFMQRTIDPGGLR